MRPSLTEKQMRIYQHVRGKIVEDGSAPTLHSLCSEFGVSFSTMHKHVTALVSKGYLKRIPHQAKGLLVADADLVDQLLERIVELTSECQALRRQMKGRANRESQ